MYHEGRAHVQEVEGLKVKIGGGREHRLVRMVLRQGPNQTYISQYEVTQEEWDTVLEKKPAMRNGALPVEPSDERLIREFLAKMKKRTGFESRLPTREEWTSMSSAAMAWPELDVSGNPLSRFLLLRGKGGDIERAPWPVGGSGLADELGCLTSSATLQNGSVGKAELGTPVAAVTRSHGPGSKKSAPVWNTLRWFWGWVALGFVW
ncbi:MAG: hypothetical protein K2Q23_17485 [Bryobacteraceae bacterium]|nr:hypothetical protein [Bryobacteraceae bacterium]